MSRRMNWCRPLRSGAALALLAACSAGAPATDEATQRDNGDTQAQPASSLGALHENDFVAGSTSHGYAVRVGAGQAVDAWVGGVRTGASSTPLRTKLTVYAPGKSLGSRGKELGSSAGTGADGYRSRVTFTAEAAGDYLVVVTSTEGVPGHYDLWVTCPGGACIAGHDGTGPKPKLRTDPSTYANPQVLSYIQLHFGPNASPGVWPSAHVSALVALLAADAVDPEGGRGIVAASDAAMIANALQAAGADITPADRAKLTDAVDAWVGTPTTFGQNAPRAQVIALTGLTWEDYSGKPPEYLSSIAASLRGSWPGSSPNGSTSHRLGRNDLVYGYIADLELVRNTPPASVWDGQEFLSHTGKYLGDYSSGPVPEGDGDR